ncbi:membrane protein [Arsukibacterium ikkense]|uniref:Membrane protein n=1 Tax=Arsukibacterium ikkense TaxID=336831 RepID=A0A0M2V1L3_9GAMM|nr:efflux RND transporter periplasmic adaptor subunit [Arsukibacterium ikkense]KKO44536.1 membrane protein [Arsukibacterium ikkense]
MPTKHRLQQLPILLSLGLVAALTGCNEPEIQVPVYQVAPATLLHKVHSEGELFAVNSVNINAPRNVQGPRFIASLAREFSRVEPGDVVVTFDASQLERSQRKANTGLSSVLADEQQKLAEQQNEQRALGLDQSLITQEFTFADRFSIDNVQIRSRLEILDSMQNKEYLGEKQQYLGWQEQSFSQRSSGELELLQLQRGQQQNLLQQAESGLAELEVKAPHAGILLFESNWRGEKPEVGGMVFPGFKIGSIPDLSLQHLKLQVIEQEAIGLAPGQRVSFYLAAWPDSELTGQIVTVGAIAQSRERRDPRKYIEVIVAPEQQDPRFMPGIKVIATLWLNEKPGVLKVPLQAIFSEQQQLFVYKRQGSRFVKQPISLGSKSLSHAEISTGVAVGDEIALINPES